MGAACPQGPPPAPEKHDLEIYCGLPDFADVATNGYPGVVLFNSAWVLLNSARVPTRVCGPCESKNTALGVFRTPGGGVLGTSFTV